MSPWTVKKCDLLFINKLFIIIVRKLLWYKQNNTVWNVLWTKIIRSSCGLLKYNSVFFFTLLIFGTERFQCTILAVVRWRRTATSHYIANFRVTQEPKESSLIGELSQMKRAGIPSLVSTLQPIYPSGGQDTKVFWSMERKKGGR